jgi:hypothetical protein
MDAICLRLARIAAALALIGAAVLPLRTARASTLIGDVNGDCRVDILDLALIARAYLTGVGSLLYSPKLDLNGDGVINILDIQIAAAHFNQHC